MNCYLKLTMDKQLNVNCPYIDRQDFHSRRQKNLTNILEKVIIFRRPKSMFKFNAIKSILTFNTA